MRPDGHYGLSKAFGENLAQFYWDRHGIETVSLRIGSSFPEPKDRRMLATWLSYDDLERLVVAGAHRAGGRPQHRLRHVGQHHDAGGTTRRRATSATAPQDSSEPFRAAVEARQPADRPRRPGRRSYQGGAFVAQGPVRLSAAHSNPPRRHAHEHPTLDLHRRRCGDSPLRTRWRAHGADH